MRKSGFVIIRLLLLILLVSTLHHIAFCLNAQFDSLKIIQELGNLDNEITKLKNRNYQLSNSINQYKKEFNSEIHAQQYKNDSLFETILLLHNDINDINKELNKIERNIAFLRKTDLENQSTSNNNFVLIVILLSVIFIISIAFIILNRRKFTNYVVNHEKKTDKSISMIGENILTVQLEFVKKLEDSIKSLTELNEGNKKDLIKKINDQRDAIESKLREINNQLEDKFK